jgi:predicted ATPase
MITQIQLRNFKCFRNLTLPLTGLNLLAGSNGMGKSSILQSLLLLRQSEFALRGQNLSLAGPLVDLGTPDDLLFEFSDTAELGICWQTETALYDWSFDLGDNHSRWLNPETLSSPDQQCLFGKDLCYLSADRLGPQHAYPLANSFDNNRLGVRGEYTAHYLTVHGDDLLSPEICQTGLSRSLLTQVQSWLSCVCPGISVVVNTDKLMESASLAYSFPVKERHPRTRAYKSGQVGFGISYALAVIVAILTAKPGSLTLIENPEAHLHPRGISKLGELLALVARAGSQFVVESHSDHLLNGIRVAVKQGKVAPEQVGLAFFEPSPNFDTEGLRAVRNIKVRQDGRLDHWPDGFFDEWDRNLDELLT